MLFRIFNKEITNPAALFSGHYIEVKAFYAWQFNKFPCVSFVGETDVTRAYTFIRDRFQYQIESVYQHAWHEHHENKMFFNNSIFVFQGNRMIELANDYCQVLFAPTQYGWASEVVKELVAFRKIPEGNAGRVVGFARQPAEN